MNTAKIRFFTAIATTMLASLALSSAPASAKTAKDCQKEWRADKAAMQAAGKTEKAYVAECRGTPAKPKAAAAPAKVKEEKGGY
jgi:hypothetical protein